MKVTTHKKRRPTWKEVHTCKHHGLQHFRVWVSKNGYTDRTCLVCQRARSARNADKANARFRARRVEAKQWAIEYKGGSCSSCGYDKCLAALEFHHRDTSKKDNIPSHLLSQNQPLSDKRKAYIAVELDKCDLLCANCHREIHDAERRARDS